MAGIYFHIPYCKQACHYCDFHFSTQRKNEGSMLAAMHKELLQFKDYFGNEEVESIYFGGGSPSHVASIFIQGLIEKARELFRVSDKAEITLEANPDDMSKNNLKDWLNMGINRLSVGIQSFNDRDLTWMNRAHDSDQALQCMYEAQEQGFSNLSLDLIYGIPDQSLNEWKKNLELAIQCGVQHISAYCLTIESNTAFGKRKTKGELTEKSDEKTTTELRLLQDMLRDAGFEQYEISNFAQNGFYAKHNTSYWLNKAYLGIGPSAHSYKNDKREWNISNNNLYIKQSENGAVLREYELLSDKEKYNELILTGLRTKWGISLKEIQSKFEIDIENVFQDELEKYADSITIDNGYLKLKQNGIPIADRIAVDFFMA
ncbi:MAG: radical SAM family heme chaperone HemW [Bacteroidota bacterium]